MHEALLYEKRPGSQVQCHTCQWRCVINPGKRGVCRVYQNIDGTLFNLGYAHASSVAADPIEKKPLFHFHPGSRVFSLGGWGCNFHCEHCQNWEIACPDADQPRAEGRVIAPEESVEMVKETGCRGIAWTYNEPTMWFEYTLDSARLARQKNYYTVYVTNGFTSIEALDAIGPYLDAWRVDIKGFSDRFYRDIARIQNWRGILDVAQRAKEKWHMHIEVVTNIIPTMNDDDAQLEDMTKWIAGALGVMTPWHITRFFPQHRLVNLPPTPLATLERAYEIGKQAGLKFIYTGNVPGSGKESTVCYNCGNMVVRRTGYQVSVVGLEGSRCRRCHAELNFVV